MALAAVVDSLDAVAEPLRDQYTEGEGGKFYLSVEGVDALPSVRGLKNAHESTKTTKAELQKKLEAFQGVDPEEFRRLKEAADQAEQDRLAGEGDFNRLREQMEARHRTEVEKRDGEIQKRDLFIERLVITNQLDAALDKADILPEYKRAARALLMEEKPRVVHEGDEYRGIFKTDLGDAEISAYVEEWGKSDAAAPFKRASGTTGSGATGGGGKGGGEANPWAKDTFNLTRQGEITRQDAEKAKRLKAAAGA